ncbi:MAG: hypothetical protein QXW30_08170, partial [Saccharolobus sp.]
LLSLSLNRHSGADPTGFIFILYLQPKNTFCHNMEALMAEMEKLKSSFSLYHAVIGIISYVGRLR